MDSHVLVLDLGTSRCKAAVINEKGNVLAKHIKEYDIFFPQEGFAEQDANQVWKMVKEVIGYVTSRVEHPEKIRGMGFSLQGEAVIPIDEAGSPLHRTILGMDTRCVVENDFLKDLFGEEEIYKITGMPIHTVNTLPKILWLKKNKKDIFNKAWKFVLYEDYLTMKLAGEPVIDASLASRTQLYDIHKNQWSAGIANRVGIDIAKLSRVVKPGEIMAEMKEELISEFGLTAPVYLVAGGHDQACAALGSGLINNFDTMDSIGTAEVVEVATDTLKLSKDLMKAKISTYKHVLPGMFLTMTLNHTAGLLVKWFIDNFFIKEINKAADIDRDKYDYIFEKLIVNKPSYKFVVPHFNGSGTPWANDKDLGIFLGLNLSDDKYSLLQAVLEGLVYELKTNVEILEHNDYDIGSLITVGGGAKSAQWLKIRANILDKEIISTTDKDVAIMGAYLLAARAINIFSSIREGVQQTILTAQRVKIKPDVGLTEKYQQLFDYYKKVYAVNKEFNLAINSLKE